MFTGIVTHTGKVRAVRDTNRDRRFEIETDMDLASLEMGASVSHSGVCLTVVDKGDRWFATEVSRETLTKTTLAYWHPGRLVNLERAAKVGDELGGHIVSGHVDGVGEVVSITPIGGSHDMKIRAIAPLHRYIAAKGSIAVEGVSLTVNEVEGEVFSVNVIPHTWDITTLCKLEPLSRVNLEIDMLARYLARWRETA